MYKDVHERTQNKYDGVLFGFFQFGFLSGSKQQLSKRDLAKAFSSYMQAASAGNPLAQFNVASMYLNGEGTDRDYKEAIEWFKKSAENGNAKAAFNLGVMYYTGQGVKPSEAAAREWFKKSAKNGNAFAPYAIERLGQDMTFYPRDLSDI